MAKQTQIDKPRIFISHAWEDKALVRRLEQELQQAGAEVWVDHTGIRGGDNLPRRISDALEWCNTLLLVWSEAARDSHWVELEWTNAIVLKRAIIPCRLTDAELPGILANKVSLDFRDADEGLSQLLHALNLAKKPVTPAATDAAAKVTRVIHNQLREEPEKVKPKPPQIKLRSQPLEKLTGEAVKTMLQQHGFYCKEHPWSKEWSNPQGKGIRHEFDLQKDGKVVIDHATGLMWQQSGSPESLEYADAEKYIHDLNDQRFAGYNDWRLPTLEEAMSLMEPKQRGELYVDPLFDRKQSWIWTSDKHSVSSVWYVSFSFGNCNHYHVDSYHLVRAVR